MSRAHTVNGVKEFLEEDKEPENIACFCDVGVCPKEMQEDCGVVQPESEVQNIVRLILQRKQRQESRDDGPKLATAPCGNGPEETHVDDLFDLVNGTDDHVLEPVVIAGDARKA